VATTVPADLGPGVYAYRVGLYSVRPTGEYDNLPVRDPTGHTVGDSAPLGWHVVRGPAPVPPAVPSDGRLGDAVRLVGYDLTDSGCGPGRRLTMSLQWTAERPLDQDYTVFIHLVGTDGKIVAQHDGPPAEGRLPTSAWPPGDRIVDAHPLALSAPTPTRLRALVGLYEPSSGQRLGGPDAAVALPLTLADCPRA
jgi:hypothetical protein